MTDQPTAVGPRRQWKSATRVEHVVSPGPRNRRHLRGCTCQCEEWWTCPTCGNAADIAAVSGRWDGEKGYTARPFDPVWVRLTCGCKFGDASLSTPPEGSKS